MHLYDLLQRTSRELADKAIETEAEAGAVARRAIAVEVAARAEVLIQRWTERTEQRAKAAMN